MTYSVLSLSPPGPPDEICAVYTLAGQHSVTGCALFNAEVRLAMIFNAVLSCPASDRRLLTLADNEREYWRPYV